MRLRVDAPTPARADDEPRGRRPVRAGVRSAGAACRPGYETQRQSAARPAPMGRQIIRSADARMTSKVPNPGLARHRINCDAGGHTPWGRKVSTCRRQSASSSCRTGDRCSTGGKGGERTTSRGAGGLVTALSGLGSQLDDGVWVCAALSDEDVVVAQESPDGLCPPELGDDDLRVRLVALDPDAQDDFYTVIANPLLWFVQHHLYDLKTGPNITRREIDAFEDGYVAVNRRLRRRRGRGGRGARRRRHRDGARLPLLPGAGRGAAPAAPTSFLHHFVHIPWPRPDAWRVLPPADARGAVPRAARQRRRRLPHRALRPELPARLPGAARPAGRPVGHGGRQVDGRVGPGPLVPDLHRPRGLRGAGASRRRCSTRTELGRPPAATTSSCGSTAPTRARTSSGASWPTTSCSRTTPSWPSGSRSWPCSSPAGRTSPEYADYLERIRRIVDEVNRKHGTGDWQPIDLRLEDNLDLAVAAYKQFDVLMVNAIFDGMNLVAKESIVVNRARRRPRPVGEHRRPRGARRLRRHAAPVRPPAAGRRPVRGAHHAGPRAPRPARARCAQVVRQNDVAKWLQVQLADIGRAAGT